MQHMCKDCSCAHAQRTTFWPPSQHLPKLNCKQKAHFHPDPLSQAVTAAAFPPPVSDALNIDALLTPEERAMRVRVRKYMVRDRLSMQCCCQACACCDCLECASHGKSSPYAWAR